MNTPETSTLEGRITDSLDGVRRSATKARGSGHSAIDYTNALRLTRALARKGGPFAGDASALDRAILVLRESEASVADVSIRAHLASQRTALLDELLELRQGL